MRTFLAAVVMVLLVPVADAASSAPTGLRWASRRSTTHPFSAQSVVRRTLTTSRTSRTSTSRTSSAKKSTSSVASAATYSPYSAAVLQDGAVKVLFFTAASCQACQRTEMTAKAWYPSRTFLPLYAVNFAAETALRQKYAVAHENTFVKIDGAGKSITSIADPMLAALITLLKR